MRHKSLSYGRGMSISVGWTRNYAEAGSWTTNSRLSSGRAWVYYSKSWSGSIFGISWLGLEGS